MANAVSRWARTAYEGARRAMDLWVAEFDHDAAWHLARKIEVLIAWGDEDGAAALVPLLIAVRRNRIIKLAKFGERIGARFKTIRESWFSHPDRRRRLPDNFYEVTNEC